MLFLYVTLQIQCLEAHKGQSLHKGLRCKPGVVVIYQLTVLNCYYSAGKIIDMLVDMDVVIKFDVWFADKFPSRVQCEFLVRFEQLVGAFQDSTGPSHLNQPSCMWCTTLTNWPVVYQLPCALLLYDYPCPRSNHASRDLSTMYHLCGIAVYYHTTPLANYLLSWCLFCWQISLWVWFHWDLSSWSIPEFYWPRPPWPTKVFRVLFCTITSPQ